MAGPRQPVELVLANGKKHLTKAEIKQRLDSEVKPCTDEISAPSCLTAAQKKTFNTLAGQLQKIKIMGETDVDTLARYIIAQSLYEQAVKDLRAAQKTKPKCTEADAEGGAVLLAKWAMLMDTLDKRQDRYFKQAHTCASALGLTISARCKLEVPVKEEAPKANKFAKFEAQK